MATRMINEMDFSRPVFDSILLPLIQNAAAKLHA